MEETQLGRNKYRVVKLSLTRYLKQKEERQRKEIVIDVN